MLVVDFGQDFGNRMALKIVKIMIRKNGSDVHRYEEQYISSALYHYPSESVNPVLPGKPWNVGYDLLKFVCGI